MTHFNNQKKIHGFKHEKKSLKRNIIEEFEMIIDVRKSGEGQVQARKRSELGRLGVHQ